MLSCWEKAAVIIIVGLLAMFVIAMVVYLPIGLETNRQCLKYGWKTGEVTWDLRRYCIREENEYEVVKPLPEIIEEAASKE
jgi:hypothetical protein